MTAPEPDVAASLAAKILRTVHESYCGSPLPCEGPCEGELNDREKRIIRAACRGYLSPAEVEAKVAAAKAAAWDEGYDARGVDISNEGLTELLLTPNPYRADTIATTEES